MFFICSTDAPYQDLDNNKTKHGKFDGASLGSLNGESLSLLGTSKRDVNLTKISYPLVLSWLATADLAGKNDDSFFKSTTTTSTSSNANTSVNNNSPTSTILITKFLKEDSSITAVAAAPILPKPEPLQSTSRQDESISFPDESLPGGHQDDAIHFEELPPTTVGVKSRDQIRRDLSRLSARLRSNNNAAAVVTDADNTNANSKLPRNFSDKHVGREVQIDTGGFDFIQNVTGCIYLERMESTMERLSHRI